MGFPCNALILSRINIQIKITRNEKILKLLRHIFSTYQQVDTHILHNIQILLITSMYIRQLLLVD